MAESPFKPMKLTDFPPPRDGKVLSFDSKQLLAEAVAQLDKINTLCGPVYEDTPEGKRFVGVLDVVGVVFFLLDAVEKELQEAGCQSGDFSKWLGESKALKTLTVKDVIDAPRWLAFVCLEESAMLSDAMALLGREHFHRVLITNSTGEIVNVITQSAVVKVISDHLDMYESIAGKTLDQVGLANHRPVVSVSVDDIVMSAFKAIRDNHVSGVPLVDETGAVAGCFSNRHIRQVVLRGTTTARSLAEVLAMPITEFLASLVSTGLHGRDMHPIITCKPSDTLGHIVRKLSHSRIHRIFLVDDDHRPIRVISLCDIIEVLLPAEEALEANAS